MRRSRRWPKRLLWLPLVAAGTWAGFFALFVHPNPARVADPLAQLDGVEKRHGARRSVAIDLIDRLPSALVHLPRLAHGRAALAPLESITDYPYAPSDAPEGVALSVTQGKHAMLREQRNSIYLPTDGLVAFDLDVPPDARLSFGLSILSRPDGIESPPVTFTVTVDEGEAITKVEESTLTPEPLYPHSETEFWYHSVGKFLTVDADFFNGRWYDRSVDLSAWAGKRVRITFDTRTADGALAHGFVGTPVITVPDSAPDQPNVVVFVLDTLRGDFVGAVNPDAKGISPAIDGVADRGMAFATVRSAANWSRGSYQSMFLGLPTPRLGYGHRWSFTEIERKVFYTRDLAPLPDLMRKAGYTTVTVGNNPFTYDGSLVGVHLGFDQAVDIQREPYDTEVSTREAIRWLKEKGDRRFFMMFTLNSPHSPFRPPFKYLPTAFTWTTDLQRILYRGAVAYGDDYFGEFLAALDRLGLKENTLVVITGDHGVILDHPGAIKGCADCGYEPINATHTHTLYEEENRVPFIVAGPGVVKKSAPVDDVTLSLLDLAPTVAAMSGVPVPESWWGVSADDLLKGTPDAERQMARNKRILPAEGGEVWMAATPQGEKYLRRGREMARLKMPMESPPRVIREQRFDLTADPEERLDLAGSDAASLLRMRDLFDRRYPRHRTIGKGIVKRGERPVFIRVETPGRFVFFDVVKEEGKGRHGLAAPSDGVRILKIRGDLRFYFETIPDEAPVTITVENAPLYTGVAASKGEASVTYVPANDLSMIDRNRLLGERIGGPGVYFALAPFASWQADAAAGVKLDPELEALMKKWGYL